MAIEFWATLCETEIDIANQWLEVGALRGV